jgi:hypothetical protein
MGLNFELGAPDALEEHKAIFARSHSQLAGSGGLISILNHPCTLVMRQWFSTELKSAERIEAGFEHFDRFLSWALALPGVRPTCAGELPALYPDRARGRGLRREDLSLVASALSDEICFVRLGDLALTAAEAFGLLTSALRSYCSDGVLPQEVLCVPIDNPPQPPLRSDSGHVTWDAFCLANEDVAGTVAYRRALPRQVQLGALSLSPGDYLAALAAVMTRLLAGLAPPEQVTIRPAPLRFEDYVDERAARSGWSSVMMPPGFAAPGLLDLAKLGAWTLKPAVPC